MVVVVVVKSVAVEVPVVYWNIRLEVEDLQYVCRICETCWGCRGY